MSAAESLIPELEDVARGPLERRTKTVQRIANLFVDGAAQFQEEHVQLFDDVLTRLVAEIETKARTALAAQLAPIENAPPRLMRAFARDDDISVAGPVLLQSPRLADDDLLEVARGKSQAHLLAISERQGVPAAVTDVLVARGDQDVVHNVAGNRSAQFSDGSLSTLVERAHDDGALAEAIGARDDIPPHLFRALLTRASAMVQQRLLAAARPETRTEIKRVLEKVTQEVAQDADRVADRVAGEAVRAAPKRDYAAAHRAVLQLHREGELDEARLAAFAQDRKFEETVAALSILCGISVEVADRLIDGERADPVLILCRAAGYSWPTARAIIKARPGARGTSAPSLDTAFTNFEKLSPATAQRVLRFWQVHQPDDAA